MGDGCCGDQASSVYGGYWDAKRSALLGQCRFVKWIHVKCMPIFLAKPYIAGLLLDRGYFRPTSGVLRYYILACNNKRV